MPYLRRRELLSGIGLFAGSPLLGTFCRNMTPDALGQPLTRKRAFFYMMDGGMGEDCYAYNQPRSITESFVPSGNADGTIKLGNGWGPALKDYLGEMIFLRDLYHPFNAYGHGSHYFLSATQLPGVAPERFASNDPPARPAGISLDRMIGKAIHDKEPYDSLVFSGSGWSGSQSSDGPGTPASALSSDPVKAYATLFSRDLPTAGDPAATAAYVAERRSVFDLLRGDLLRLNSRLAAPERAKMEQYVDSIRKVELRLTSLDPAKAATCTKPATPPAIAPRDANLKEVLAARLEMAIAAMVCGLTKVVSVQFGARSMPFLGEGNIGTHTMQHGAPATGSGAFKIPITEMHRRYYDWHANNVRTVRERLGAAREGSGSIMDNSLILPWQSTGQFHHQGPAFQYAWIIGTAGGYFRQMNKYKRYQPMTHSMSDVFVSVAKAMGVTPRNAAGKADRFGDERPPGGAGGTVGQGFLRWMYAANRPFPAIVNTGPNPDLT